MKLCDYGCGQEAEYKQTSGKWCCSVSYQSCPSIRNKHSITMKKIRKDPKGIYNSNSFKKNHSDGMKKVWADPDSVFNSDLYKKKKSDLMKNILKDPNSKLNSISCKEKRSNSIKKIHKDPNGVFNSIEYRKKRSNIMIEAWKEQDSKLNSISCKEKRSNAAKDIWKDPDSVFNSISFRKTMSDSMKKLHKDPQSIFNSTEYKISRILTIEKIKEKYPFFSKIEEMRYISDKSKEIQVHCKNHNCKNSKEKDGWFTPTYIQLYERIRQLESKEGNGGAYLYCSQHCKDTCPLYNLKGDPFKDTTPLPYTAAEIQVYNKTVLEREKGLCEYCGEPAEHVHHIYPKKLEPFFALDPDYGVACCEKHHYKYAHKDECSTGNLANIVCSVESQKFLNQAMEFLNNG